MDGNTKGVKNRISYYSFTILKVNHNMIMVKEKFYNNINNLKLRL